MSQNDLERGKYVLEQLKDIPRLVLLISRQNLKAYRISTKSTE